MTKRVVAALGLATALVTTGCAEAPPPPARPAVAFPSRAEIAAIPEQQPRAEAFGAVGTSADPWTVEVEAKGQQAPYEDASAWGDFLRAAVKGHARAVSLTPSLKCASEELAKFARRSERLAPPNLTRFIVARCGAVVTSPRPLGWQAAATASVTDAALVELAAQKLGPSLEAVLAKADARQLAGGPHLAVGLGVVRDEKGATVVILVGDDEATVASTPLRADARHLVSIQGEVRGELASIDALINRGTSGFAECQRQGEMPPPHFAFRCQLADGDPYAWVEILGRRPGLALSRVLASGIVTAGGDAPIVFKSKPDAAPVLVSTPAQLSIAILDGVNHARTVAHLAPLAYEAKQSAENARLTGTLINAALADAPREGSDRAALGLLAGWDVTGMIRSAKIGVEAFAPTHDASVWLDWTLERPAGRSTLLDPASALIAIGTVVPEGGSALGAAVTTYALFDSDDHRRDEATVYKRIDAARAARRLPPARFLSDFPEMREHAGRVLSDGASPIAEMQAMLAVANTRSGESARGAVLETSDLDGFTLPDIATRPGELHIAVAVTHHQVPGAAWGQYVVFFVTVGENVAP